MLLLPSTWHDAIEIIFFSTIFYYLALWLRKDRQQNILWYFYGYCGLFLLAYNFNLSTMSTTLLFFSPIIIMLFIIVHQETLQRNFVALKHIKPAQHNNHNWLETLIQTCLIGINQNKTVTCILERSDNIQTLLTTTFFIKACINKELLELILKSNMYDEHKMIWIDTHGTLQSINTEWRHSTIQNNQSTQNRLSQLHDDARLYTTKTDALVFTITPIRRTFTIIMHGNELQNVHAHHAYQIIYKYLHNKHAIKPKKGKTHASVSKNNSEQERTP